MLLRKGKTITKAVTGFSDLIWGIWDRNQVSTPTAQSGRFSPYFLQDDTVDYSLLLKNNSLLLVSGMTSTNSLEDAPSWTLILLSVP